MERTFYWHDYETFGIDPSRDRPAQFAGLRTDENLNPIGDPLVIYCQPQPDILPAPQACLVTGITPQLAVQEGLPEPEFIAEIEAELSRPGTCGVGYNSIRFDDEVTRYTLYRNFYDPYAREWKNGNSRWDIIDMLRLTRAIRPEGIEWPTHEDGRPSFRLEDLTAANGLAHEAAHDALSDVTATIELARLVREKQPQLFDYVYQHRGKQQVQKLLDLREQKPFFHVSGRLSREHLYSAIMMPLARHPTNNNAVICIDLSSDPEALITLDVEAICQRVFSTREQLPEDVDRIPLKAVHINRSPVVVTHKLVDQKAAQRLKIDLSQCEEHWQRLRRVDVSSKLQQVFSEQAFPEPKEAEQQLYGGFLGGKDHDLLAEIRGARSDDFKKHHYYFSDQRYNQLLFSYRARYFPDSLSEKEQQQWRDNCIWRLTDDKSGYLTLAQLHKELEDLLKDTALTEHKRNVLVALQKWGQLVTDKFAL